VLGRSGSARCWGSAGGAGGDGGSGDGVTKRGASTILDGGGGAGGDGGGGGTGASANGLGGGGVVGLGGAGGVAGCGGRGGAGMGGGADACGGGGAAGGAGGAWGAGAGTGGGEGGTSTGAPGGGAELKTMSKPCSSTSKAPWRGALGSSSRKTTTVASRCTRIAVRIARVPRPGRFGLSQLTGRRPPASGAPRGDNLGSARRMVVAKGS